MTFGGWQEARFQGVATFNLSQRTRSACHIVSRLRTPEVTKPTMINLNVVNLIPDNEHMEV